MGNKNGFQERRWKKGGGGKQEVGGLAKKEHGSRDQESRERMCEEQLGLVTVRHQVPGFIGVIPSSQATKQEHGVLPNHSGEVGHGGGLYEGELACCVECKMGENPSAPGNQGLHITEDAASETS